jgi:hypothetical protein
VADLWADIARQIVEGADVILGAFLGGGAAVTAGYFADRRRFKREDKYRDHAERREAYAQFLAASERIYNEDFSSEARRDLRRALMTVKLITQSGEVHRHSDLLSTSVLLYAITENAGEREKLRMDDARKVVDFIDAAREDLDKPKL